MNFGSMENASIIEPLMFDFQTCFKLLIHNIPKWTRHTLKFWSICCKTFKVCPTNFERYTLKGWTSCRVADCETSLESKYIGYVYESSKN